MKRLIRNKKVRAMMVVGLVAIFLAASGVIASPPMGSGDPPVESTINYQGQLTDSEGNPLNGTYDMEFRFYDSATGGSQVGSTITKNDVTVTNGLFSVKLDVNQSGFYGQGSWLEAKVEGETLSPRQEILPVPYALSLKPGAVIDGEEDFGAALSVFNSGEGNALGVYGEAWNTDDWENIGGYFVAGGSMGRGVYGYAPNTGDATNYGGFFYASGVQGRGVFGEAEGDSGIGVEGWASDHGDVENYGGHFTAGGSRGIGVYGKAENEVDAKNYGGYFLAAGQRGIGVYGEALNTGGYFKATGWKGTGVFGWATGSNGYGVSGYSAGSTAKAVYGRSDGQDGYGGYFYASGTEGTGVFAQATGSSGTGVLAWGSGENGQGVRGEAVGRYGHGGVFIADGTHGKGIWAKGRDYAADLQGKVAIRSYSSGALVMELGEGLDYAEGFDVAGSTEIEPGAVLIIDPNNPGKLTISDAPYDTKVAGIVTGAKECGSGIRLGADQFDYDVALAGRVYCNVDATEAGVEPGDLLTTSATPGYAMKVTDYDRAQGAILGKAMEGLEKGQRGQILVLVTLQ